MCEKEKNRKKRRNISRISVFLLLLLLMNSFSILFSFPCAPGVESADIKIQLSYLDLVWHVNRIIFIGLFFSRSFECLYFYCEWFKIGRCWWLLLLRYLLLARDNHHAEQKKKNHHAIYLFAPLCVCLNLIQKIHTFCLIFIQVINFQSARLN